MATTINLPDGHAIFRRLQQVDRSDELREHIYPWVCWSLERHPLTVESFFHAFLSAYNRLPSESGHDWLHARILRNMYAYAAAFTRDQEFLAAMRRHISALHQPC